MLGLMFQYSIEVGADHVGDLDVHIAIFDHCFGFTDRFAQEHFCFGPVFAFFIDQAETVEAVGVIGLCENEFFESLFGCIEITGFDAIESLVPPFDIIFFLKGADIWVLLPALFNVV